MRGFITALVLCVFSIIFGSPVKSMIGAYWNAQIQGEEDIVPVEFIESTGTQYIDTGIIPNGVKTTIEFALTDVKNGQIAGCHNPNNQRYYPLEVYGSRTKYFRRVDKNDNLVNLCGSANTERHTTVYYYDINNSSFDGIESQSSGFNISSAIYTCILFGISMNGVFVESEAIPMKIYRCTMEKDGELLRDFIPVRFLNEENRWEGAMYDNVSGEMFRNQGTGEFIFWRNI